MAWFCPSGKELMALKTYISSKTTTTRIGKNMAAKLDGLRQAGPIKECQIP